VVTERPVRGRLDGPPRIAAVLAIAWLIVVAWAQSDAGVPFPRWMALTGIGVALLGWWLLRFVVAAVVGRRNPGILFAHAMAWAVIPVAAAGAIGVGNTFVLLRGRVWLSSRAFVKSAAALERIPADDLRTRPQRIGLFWVQEFQRADSELRFITTECGLVDTCGLIYSPAAAPVNRGEDSFLHLFGDWWHLHQSW
jgi:hypothetical protein